MLFNISLNQYYTVFFFKHILPKSYQNYYTTEIYTQVSDFNDLAYEPRRYYIGTFWSCVAIDSW